MTISIFSIIRILPLTALFAFFACNPAPQPAGTGSDSLSMKNNVNLNDSLERQGHTPPRPQHPPKSIEEIQVAYSGIISKLKGGELDSTGFKYSCNGERTGTISYFTENGKLRFIEHQYSEYSHFSSKDRYFVSDSTLFFVFTSSTAWQFEGPEGSTRDDITEKRVYLTDRKLVKCLEKKFTIRSQRTDNPRSESIPSKEVACGTLQPVMKTFALLSNFRAKPTKGCLE